MPISQLYKHQNHLKNLKNGWRQNLMLSIPSRKNTLVIAAKKYAKLHLKVFSACQICLICPINFYQDRLRKPIYSYNSSQPSLNFSIVISYDFKAFLKFECKCKTSELRKRSKFDKFW